MTLEKFKIWIYEHITEWTANSNILAVYIGGSTIWGISDEYSDKDIYFITKNGEFKIDGTEYENEHISLIYCPVWTFFPDSQLDRDSRSIMQIQMLSIIKNSDYTIFLKPDSKELDLIYNNIWDIAIAGYYALVGKMIYRVKMIIQNDHIYDEAKTKWLYYLVMCKKTLEDKLIDLTETEKENLSALKRIRYKELTTEQERWAINELKDCLEYKPKYINFAATQLRELYLAL